MKATSIRLLKVVGDDVDYLQHNDSCTLVMQLLPLWVGNLLLTLLAVLDFQCTLTTPAHGVTRPTSM
eukprot:SM000282S10598  [mRNA]  locus=s282:50615:51153:+ [translate_table: standard]